jgi:hypothetical protein
MQLLDPYVDFCFTFPMLFVFECSVGKGLLFVVEMATFFLKKLGKRSIMSQKGANAKSGYTLPTAQNLMRELL